jgi:ketosteroid isomerase-like protein
MNTETMKTSNETQLRAFIEERVEAIRNKDIDKAIAHYADDVVLFDVVGPLQQTGVVMMRQRLEEWFSTFEGTVGFEIKDLRITVGDDVGFCYSFNHVNAITKDGRKLDMWWRETLGWQKIKGQWLVTQAHSSVPFDTTNGQAAVTLKP